MNSEQVESLVSKLGGSIERDEGHPARPIIGLELNDVGVTDAHLNSTLGLATLKRLNISSSKITDAWLKHLSSYPALEEFIAWDTPITDVGLKHIGTAAGLKMLDLSSIAQTSDAGLFVLSNISNLEWLELSALQSSFTSEGIASLKALSKLRHLDFGDIEVLSDAYLVHLRDLPSLESLELNPYSMTDSAVASLRELTRLKKLSLSATGLTAGLWSSVARLTGLEELDVSLTLPMTDADLFQIAGLSKLRVLRIDARSLTNSGIAFLASLSELQELELNFSDGRATEPPGLEALKEALPGLQVSCV